MWYIIFDVTYEFQEWNYLGMELSRNGTYLGTEYG